MRRLAFPLLLAILSFLLTSVLIGAFEPAHSTDEAPCVPQEAVVVEHPAVEPVYEILHEFVFFNRNGQEHPNSPRWEREGWNADGQDSHGWQSTGNTKQGSLVAEGKPAWTEVVTPEVTCPKPPVDEPPVDEPPVDEPPVDEPPVDEPPVGEPVPPVSEEPTAKPTAKPTAGPTKSPKSPKSHKSPKSGTKSEQTVTVLPNTGAREDGLMIALAGLLIALGATLMRRSRSVRR